MTTNELETLKEEARKLVHGRFFYTLKMGYRLDPLSIWIANEQMEDAWCNYEITSEDIYIYNNEVIDRIFEIARFGFEEDFYQKYKQICDYAFQYQKVLKEQEQY